MGSQRREFSPEYKDEAVKLVVDTGRPVARGPGGCALGSAGWMTRPGRVALGTSITATWSQRRSHSGREEDSDRVVRHPR